LLAYEVGSLSKKPDVMSAGPSVESHKTAHKGASTSAQVILPRVEKSFRELIEEAYAALARGDIEFLLEHSDPEIEIIESPALPGAQTYRGCEGLRSAIENWVGEWDEFRIDLERVIDAGHERVITIARYHGRDRSSGAVVETRVVNLHTGRDGRGIRWEMFSSLDEAFAAIGLRKLKGES